MLYLDGNEINLIDNVMDALGCAKEAYALLPQLPPNMKPVYFRILNTIYRIRADTGHSRVSDISRALGILLPNTTRFINELVELNIVEKFTPESDKRVVLVRTTDLGEEYIQKYVLSFHKHLEAELSAIGKSDCMTMIETIHKVHQAMKKIYYNEGNIAINDHRMRIETYGPTTVTDY